MKPAAARHRTDTGSAQLIQLLRAHGIAYEPLGGAIDGVAWLGHDVRLIDFKRDNKSPLTLRQIRLLGRKCPIALIWTEDQVRLLAADMKWRRPTYDDKQAAAVPCVHCDRRVTRACPSARACLFT